jgi:Tfp pilus assembly protein PilN
MRQRHLDLLHRRPRPPLSAWLVLIAGSVVFAAVATWDSLAAAEFETRRGVVERQLAAIKEASAVARPAGLPLDSSQVAEEFGNALRVSAKLNSPWAELFATLEGEIERPIGLLALDMDAARQNFTLSAEARNFDEMLAYLRFLQDCGRFAEVVLHTHQINQQDREKPIRFRISARWGAKS